MSKLLLSYRDRTRTVDIQWQCTACHGCSKREHTVHYEERHLSYCSEFPTCVSFQAAQRNRWPPLQRWPLSCVEWRSFKTHVYPEPVNVTVFGNRVFADVIQLGPGHAGAGWALNRTWLVSLQEEDNMDAQTSTHVPATDTKDFRELPEAGRVREGFCFRAFRGAWSCWQLDFRLSASRTVKNTFLSFKATQSVGICRGCPRKWKQPYSADAHLENYGYSVQLQIIKPIQVVGMISCRVPRRPWGEKGRVQARPAGWGGWL